MPSASFFPVIKIFLLAAAAFLLAFFITPLLTHFLYKYRLGKTIRSASEAPVVSGLHKGKSGTPTMGGILVWITVLFLAVVLFYAHKFFPAASLGRLNFLTRAETLLPLGALVASSLVGLVVDW